MLDSTPRKVLSPVFCVTTTTVSIESGASGATAHPVRVMFIASGAGIKYVEVNDPVSISAGDAEGPWLSLPRSAKLILG